MGGSVAPGPTTKAVHAQTPKTPSAAEAQSPGDALGALRRHLQLAVRERDRTDLPMRNPRASSRGR